MTAPFPVPSPLPPAFVKQIKANFPADQIYTDPADCWSYGYDNSRLHSLPGAVAFATTHEQVECLVQLCNQEQVPLTARGRGTGTTGATVPARHGVVLSLEKMNSILEVSPANRYMLVQPGVTNQEAQDAAARFGFFWPPDPSSAGFCTIGGNLAHNSAGPRAVKYGTPRENTLGLRAVTGSGKSIRTGVFTTKGVVGYDLTRLLIGSEGTLAVITEATLKLTPLAESIRTLRAIYSDMLGASSAIAQIMSQPTIPCALEFIDRSALEIIARHSSLELPRDAAALLLIEVDGNRDSIEHSVANIEKAAVTEQLLEIRTAYSQEEREELWRVRKTLSPALRKIAPGKINEDIVVPVTRLPELVTRLDLISRKYGLMILNFGHAGNGNIHTNILYDPANESESNRARRCLDEVFDLVIELQGTLSGEHGVGLVKKDYIAKEIEADTLALMRGIKCQFDPNGILNPDKMFPAIPSVNRA
ncbi:MAG: FAD-binding oxidoreductase [Methylococcales bacterium]